MFNAQLLMVGAADATTYVYSPWVSRKADKLFMTVEVVAVNGATIGVTCFTKNASDTGNGAAATGNAAAVSTVTTQTKEATALKEQVRYKFACSGTTGDWILFRMLEPQWYDEVEAS